MSKMFEILDERKVPAATYRVSDGVKLAQVQLMVNLMIQNDRDLYEVEGWRWVRDPDSMEKVSVDRHLKISPKVLSEKSR